MEAGWGGDAADVCTWVKGKSLGSNVYMEKLAQKCKICVFDTADKAQHTTQCFEIH